MEYYLYILYSERLDRYYIGISHDPEMRLHYHNSFPRGWTKRGRPWELVFSKKFPSKEIALSWESFIKKQKSRELVKRIITGSFKWKQ